MSASDLSDLALAFPDLERVAQLARRDPVRTLATAESCTGGLLAAALTALPGSSTFMRGGVVAYANQLKWELLGVPEGQLSRHGAVSSEVAQAMALGVRSRLGSNLGVATTGVAGPGASEAKPAGLVYVALAHGGGVLVRRLDQDLGRHRNRVNAVRVALELVLEVLS
ncbi:MAG: CinA family protein [Candidatus Dormibacteria bacterium]